MLRDARARLDRARTAMDSAGLDALLLLNSTNLVYLSGYPAVRNWLKRVESEPGYVDMDWQPQEFAAAAQ